MYRFIYYLVFIVLGLRYRAGFSLVALRRLLIAGGVRVGLLLVVQSTGPRTHRLQQL